jgi:hypothetical protein
MIIFIYYLYANNSIKKEENRVQVYNFGGLKKMSKKNRKKIMNRRLAAILACTAIIATCSSVASLKDADMNNNTINNDVAYGENTSSATGVYETAAYTSPAVDTYVEIPAEIPQVSSSESSDSDSSVDSSSADTYGLPEEIIPESESNATKAVDEVNDDTSEESEESEESVSVLDGTVTYTPSWWSDTRMSYMDYTCITDQSSDQWKLQHWYAYTDFTTGIRMVNGRYCVAVGSQYTTTKGQYLDVVLENGTRIPCILADCKADQDTLDGLGRIGADGGIVEFVVDTPYLPYMVRQMGSNEYQFDSDWQSPVDYIVVYDNGVNIGGN